MQMPSHLEKGAGSGEAIARPKRIVCGFFERLQGQTIGINRLQVVTLVKCGQSSLFGLAFSSEIGRSTIKVGRGVDAVHHLIKQKVTIRCSRVGGIAVVAVDGAALQQSHLHALVFTEIDFQMHHTINESQGTFGIGFYNAFGLAEQEFRFAL